MDLHDAATFFDEDPINDGYSGAFVGNAQTASFDDSSSDGATSRRRVLSTGPAFTIPTRRVVELYGDRWLIGQGTPDGWAGSTIRRHYTMKRATDLMALLTPAQALAAAAGVPAYCQKVYFKDTANALTDAEYDTFWNVFVVPAEPAAKGTILRDAAGRHYRVRNDYLPLEGLRVCQSDALEPNAFQVCTFNTGTYDPVTETQTAGTSAVNGLWIEPGKFYRYRHKSDQQVQPGDLNVLVPTSLSVLPGATFMMLGKKWVVLTVQPELDAQVLHTRLA